MLINCSAYRDGFKVADIAVADISDWIVKPGTFVWVALRDATAAELLEMQEEFGLHDLAVEDARNGHQRPKIEEYGEVIFVVLKVLEMQQRDRPDPAREAAGGETRDPVTADRNAPARADRPTQDPAGGEIQIGEVAIFVAPSFVLSVRNNSRHGFLGVRERCEREPELLRHGPGFVLYALMDAVVDRYFPLLDAIETELEAIEARIFEPRAARSNIERLYELKRQASTLRHAVAPLLEVLGKLHGGRVPAVCATTQEYFRDVHDHLTRIATAVDGIRDTIGIAIQVNLSMVTIEESENTKRLAGWAGVFAVSTAMAGIWGMNFKNMPELSWTYGYPMALAVIASAAGIVFWRFRRAGWL